MYWQWKILLLGNLALNIFTKCPPRSCKSHNNVLCVNQSKCWEAFYPVLKEKRGTHHSFTGMWITRKLRLASSKYLCIPIHNHPSQILVLLPIKFFNKAIYCEGSHSQHCGVDRVNYKYRTIFTTDYLKKCPLWHLAGCSRKWGQTMLKDFLIVRNELYNIIWQCEKHFIQSSSFYLYWMEVMSDLCHIVQ